MENNTENKNFLVDMLRNIENFDFNIFKKNRKIQEAKKEKEKDIQKELKESETTIDDVSKQRKSHVKHLFKKVMLLGFLIILITGAIILAFQDNEQSRRPLVKVKDIFNDKSSFGSIDKKDYFMEQNILNNKIDKVHNESKKNTQEVKALIISQSNEVKAYTLEELNKIDKKQTLAIDKKIKSLNTSLVSFVERKIETLDNKQIKLEANLKNVKRSNSQGLSLSNGKIVFPNLNKSKISTNQNNTNSLKTNNTFGIDEEMVEIEEEVYFDEEIVINLNNKVQTDYSTKTLQLNVKKKFKSFKLDLTKAMATVTLLEGVKAAASFAGVSEPTPALLVLEGVTYTANDTVADLRGCFLGGAAIGNINTSRVEIFGTNISCIIVADDGKKYKIEQTFTNNKVWVKGEDGGTGIQGQIVDSSGKLLAKGAAIGFMQGLSSYFLANAKTTQPIVAEDGTVSQAQALGNSLSNGAATGINQGFDMIIKKYEKILEGYFPYVDVKGGRTNLTVVFDGQMELEVTEYFEPNLEELRMNNLKRGYE